MASVPGYDPNLFVTGMDPAVYNELAGSPNKPLFNRATNGRYAPGSTFKPVVGLAALAAGVTDWERTIVDGNGTYRLPNGTRQYRDWTWTKDNAGGQGVIDLHRATLASNTFAAYADFDASPTKAWMIHHREELDVEPLYDLAFGKRPREELKRPERRPALHEQRGRRSQVRQREGSDGGSPPRDPGRAGRPEADGAAAPRPRWSVLLRRIRIRAVPSGRNVTSSTSSPETSDTRSRASEATATIAASRLPARSPEPSASLHILSASFHDSPRTWPVPRSAPSRRKRSSRSVVPGPTGSEQWRPARAHSLAAYRTAATTCTALDGARSRSNSTPR